ncbi:MAG: PQQ-binding-like beta-propeller repeat protein [Acidobacteria bacterium]|nr:PQQ-binding-like beta-propeller repeat protein [Acidobacteriota bacterium]
MRSLPLLLLSVFCLQGDNWPQWRGPGSNGVSTEKNVPAEWSPKKNVAWKTAVPGRGRSSPVVWGDRIFLTTDIEGTKAEGHKPPVHVLNGSPFRHPDSIGADVRHRLVLLCLDRKTGKILWQQTAYEGVVFDERHKAGSYAAPTPVTDGRAVYAYFGSEGFYAYDMDGKLLWKYDPGKIMTVGMGPGTSPVLAGELLILQCDSNDKKSKLVALDRKNGEIAWTTERATEITWSTPMLVEAGGKQELITTANDVVISYDVMTGKERWRGPGVKGNAVPSPVSGNGIVVVSAGYPDKYAWAFRAGGDGRKLWEYTKGTAYVPSPIFYGDYVYLVTDKGLITCLDAATGMVKYEGRRPGPGGQFAGSPVAYDGKILLTNEDGETHVIQAGPEFAVLRTNSVGEPVLASPAIANGTIFIRGRDHLFAIAQ